MQAVQSQATDYFLQNPDIPNEYAEGAAQAAGASIMAALQNQIVNGNVEGLQNMLSGNASSFDANTMGQIMQQASGLMGGYLNQQGISQATALSASQGLMPQLIQMVLGKFMSKAPGDSGFDIGSLIGLVLGGGQQQQQSNNVLATILGGVLSGGGKQGGGGSSDLLGSILGNVLGGGGKQGGGNDLLGSILGNVLGGGGNQQQQQVQQQKQRGNHNDNSAADDLLGGLLGNILGK